MTTNSWDEVVYVEKFQMYQCRCNGWHVGYYPTEQECIDALINYRRQYGKEVYYDKR